MPKKKRTKEPKSLFILMFLLGAGTVAALATYVKQEHADRVPPAEHVSEQGSSDNVTAEPNASKRQSKSDRSQEGPTVFSPVWEGEDLKFSGKKVSVPDGEDPKVFAVNEYLHITKIADPDARLLSIDVHNGIAALSFNSAMNQTHGSEDEKMLLDGLRTTMGQFQDVEKIQFFANGKPIETFGNVDLSEPLPVIKPGASETSTRTEKSAP